MQALLSSWMFRVAAIVVIALLAFVAAQAIQMSVISGQLDAANKANGRLTATLSLAVSANATNADIYHTSITQISSARAEALAQLTASNARNHNLQDELHAIQNDPHAHDAVSPTVRATVERLWPNPSPHS